MSNTEKQDWYFTVEGGAGVFGPYDSFFEAQKGIRRVQREASKDGIERSYSTPYQQEAQDETV